MRPFGIDEVEQLRVARDRANELREDWRLANASRSRFGRETEAAGPRRLHLARETAGRVLIGLGRRVLPAEVEPCN
jgi:hypothetical protein